MKIKSWKLQTTLLIIGFTLIVLSNDITSFIIIDVVAFAMLKMEFDANKVDILIKGGLFLIGIIFIFIGFKIDRLEDKNPDNINK